VPTRQYSRQGTGDSLPLPWPLNCLYSRIHWLLIDLLRAVLILEPAIRSPVTEIMSPYITFHLLLISISSQWCDDCVLQFPRVRPHWTVLSTNLSVAWLVWNPRRTPAFSWLIIFAHHHHYHGTN
jgi:hypothetical protein